MTPRTKFTLALAGLFSFVAGLFAIAIAVAWSNSAAPARDALEGILQEQAGVLVIFAGFLLAGLGFIVDAFFKAYVSAVSALAQGTQVIQLANPDHRLAPQGGSETRQLAAAINALADRYHALTVELGARVIDANAHLEEEKNWLAALMSELTQSVIVCNEEGRILLYNHRARRLLGEGRPGSVGSGGYIGLGRSIFGIMDRNQVAYALEQIRHLLGRGNENPVTQFVTTARGNKLVRAQMAPVLDRQQAISGFILTMEDVTKEVEAGTQRDILLQSLTEDTRRSAANIRAAIENFLEFPDMPQERRNRFVAIIREESLTLSERLDKALVEHSGHLKTQWPLEEICGSDLISVIRKMVQDKWGMVANTEAVDESLWLHVDSYSVVQAMIYIVGRLRNDHDVSEVAFRLAEAGRFAQLDLIWKGAPIDLEAAQAWENQPLVVDGKGSPLTLKQVAERHDGEIWCRADPGSGSAYFRMLLPMTRPAVVETARRQRDSRPEYYDLDLFHQPGQTSELDHRLLTELTYTVFDTETTGLRPSEGDEIISISAVRIVNGRLLKHEVFDQLIDPGRPVPRQSTRIHGITTQMLRGQPVLDAVLPAFHQFAEDTVLVAHNAAFDMRFLQIKEAQAGVRFIQPVLDTLLLSAVVHPDGKEHELESNAERFGISVIGRHTSLGDAILTGEIFLKLLPLLAKRGILTLKDAREAAEKSYLARIEY